MGPLPGAAYQRGASVGEPRRCHGCFRLDFLLEKSWPGSCGRLRPRAGCHGPHSPAYSVASSVSGRRTLGAARVRLFTWDRISSTCDRQGRQSGAAAYGLQLAWACAQATTLLFMQHRGTWDGRQELGVEGTQQREHPAAANTDDGSQPQACECAAHLLLHSRAGTWAKLANHNGQQAGEHLAGREGSTHKTELKWLQGLDTHAMKDNRLQSLHLSKPL